MLVSPSTGDVALLSVTANLGSLTFGLRESVKQPPSSQIVHTLYIHIYTYSGIYALESHGFHYLLKFIKRLKPTPPSYYQFHPHPQTEPLLTSRWLPVLYQWPRIFSKPSSNCLLHICLRLLHKHLQLNLYKINTSSAPNYSMFSYSVHSTNHSVVQKIRKLS